MQREGKKESVMQGKRREEKCKKEKVTFYLRLREARCCGERKEEGRRGERVNDASKNERTDKETRSDSKTKTHVQESNEPKSRVPTSVDRSLKSKKVGRVDLRPDRVVSEEERREVSPAGNVGDRVEGGVEACEERKRARRK